MLSTLVHIKDKNELENHCAFCFFISIKSGFGSTQCNSFTDLEGLVWERWSPAACLPLVLLSAACQVSERVPEQKKKKWGAHVQNNRLNQADMANCMRSFYKSALWDGQLAMTLLLWETLYLLHLFKGQVARDWMQFLFIAQTPVFTSLFVTIGWN